MMTLVFVIKLEKIVGCHKITAKEIPSCSLSSSVLFSVNNEAQNQKANVSFSSSNKISESCIVAKDHILPKELHESSITVEMNQVQLADVPYFYSDDN